MKILIKSAWISIITFCFALFCFSLFVALKNFVSTKEGTKKVAPQPKSTDRFEGKAKGVMWEDTPGYLEITPVRKTLYKGEILTLKMNLPHARQLAVILPNGQGGDVADDVFEDTPQTTYVSSEQFRNMSKIELDTITLQYPDYEDDKPTQRLVFTKTGWYVFRISDNLHECDPIYDECKVYYVNKPRPSKKS